MKKVLIIGMLDSVHFTRWLSQFEDQRIDFLIYPATKFKFVHPDLIKIVKRNPNFKFVNARFVSLYGYKEFILNKILSKVSKRFSSATRLRNLITMYDFDYIHALEIQGAGYLLLESLSSVIYEQKNIVITNWGSDIYYFEKNNLHKIKIKKVLELASYYSAECLRDYELALKNGFKGKFLPMNPNAGGFKSDVFQRNVTSSTERSLIVAKCYGGEFGLGELIIDALNEYLLLDRKYSVFFYSVTSDLESKLEKLMSNHPGRISYSTVDNKISIQEMYKTFSKAKIYIGASKSDGISTSFLEALVLGAYPIQTNTSCGNEWVERGFNAHLIEPNVKSIFSALVEVDKMANLEEIRISNKDLAAKFLDFESIKQDSLSFYGLNKNE